MRLHNTSQYPTEEVRKLVEFAMKGVNTTGVLVKVKNSSRGYRGMAYHGVPGFSPAAKMKSVERLVTIGIGGPERFPTDNMATVDRATKWSSKMTREEFLAFEEAGPPKEGWKIDTMHWSDGTIQARWRTTERHPYGGKGSPMIVMYNWREALVSVAAHEARHVWQARNHKKGKGEVDAEKFAAKRLIAYRAMYAPDQEFEGAAAAVFKR